jgi:hypothetical protein
MTTNNIRVLQEFNLLPAFICLNPYLSRRSPVPTNEWHYLILFFNNLNLLSKNFRFNDNISEENK